jgi:hypothetical protein
LTALRWGKRPWIPAFAGMTANMAGAPFESLTALRKIEGVARPTKIWFLRFFAVRK